MWWFVRWTAGPRYCSDSAEEMQTIRDNVQRSVKTSHPLTSAQVEQINL